MVQVDVRTIPLHERHAMIFRTIDELALGAALRITSDHDPRPLRISVERDYPEEFDWRYCESGPELWVVELERVNPKR